MTTSVSERVAALPEGDGVVQQNPMGVHHGLDNLGVRSMLLIAYFN